MSLRGHGVTVPDDEQVREDGQDEQDERSP